ncbi:MAG: hypothetical protein LBC14_07620 [Desulfovibrio sp.]|jgi:photosystem II stability/assembly factor-like uncharacterized protein|nr:hypothetical protein [Desulfovibrio sp.]
MIKACCIPILFGFFCAAAFSAGAGEDVRHNVWHKIALDTVHVVSFVSDPARPDTLYAVTSRGLLKSTDSGTQWVPLGTNLPESVLPSSVAVNHLNSRELYVSYDGAGIYKSSDGGNTWQAVNEGLPNLNVRCILISPKDPNLIYIGIMGGVALSTNGGRNWHMSSGFKRAVNVNAVAVDPKNPQYLFAATGGAGVFKSGNGGVSWVDVNQGLSSLSILALHIDPENPDIVLAGAYHPATPTDFYVGEANGGVFRTVDGGRTWQETGLLTTTVFSFAAAPAYPGTVYAGAWGGAYRSVDKGATWVDINSGLDNAFMHKLYVKPVEPPIILAGTTFGLLSYTDADLPKLLSAGDGVPPLVRYGSVCVAAAAVIGVCLLRRGRRRKTRDAERPVW